MLINRLGLSLQERGFIQDKKRQIYRMSVLWFVACILMMITGHVAAGLVLLGILAAMGVPGLMALRAICRARGEP